MRPHGHRNISEPDWPSPPVQRQHRSGTPDEIEGSSAKAKAQKR
jgi:hypothetical protein